MDKNSGKNESRGKNNMIEINYDFATKAELLKHLLLIYQKMIFKFPKNDCQFKIKEVYDELRKSLLKEVKK